MKIEHVLKYLRENTDYIDGQNVRMVVCHAASNDLARKVANNLNVWVKAGANRVEVNKLGMVYDEFKTLLSLLLPK